MISEMETQRRMDAIITEFSTLKQTERFNLSLEALEDGSVKVLLTDEKRPYDKAERVITPHEDISFISDAFDYPPTFSARSKMFNTSTLKEAHFDHDGYLIVVHEDSTERFKVKKENRDDVTALLKIKLGSKFNGEIRPIASPPSTNPNFK